MKKWIVYGVDRWSKELLTLARFEKIAYFIKDDNESCELLLENDFLKEIKSPEYLLREKKDELIIIISNSKKYAEKADTLIKMGFIENVHFFNGWKLDGNFYDVVGANRDWELDEKNDNHIFQSAAWEKRAEMMAEMIPDDVQTLMDLGCGDCKLRKYISKEIRYIGVDYCKREDDTIICDLNKEKLPKMNVDMYYLAGILTYIDDKEALLSQMKNAKYILMNAYQAEQFIRLDGCTFDVPAFYFQNYSNDDIINYLYKEGFVLVNCKYDYKIMNVHFYLFQKLSTI